MSLSLSAPWPNPAPHDLSLSVAAPGGEAELSAWDLSGRRVATIWRGRAESTLTLRWNGARNAGGPLPAGVYYLRLATRAGTSLVRRVALLR